MSQEYNQKIVLKSRPEGYPQLSDFELIEEQISQIGEGQLLIQVLWLSLDPYMRGRMRVANSYAPYIELGEIVVGGAVGRVIQSRAPSFSVGDIVEGSLGWQKYAISDGRGLRKVDQQLGPLSTAVGVLGMPGLTAYFGFLDVGSPKPGDVVFVSAASGAVGQIVGQIAKIMGCQVIGTAGSDEKVDFIVKELGFDAGINYKTEDLKSKIATLCPRGIDVYFDNVGGETSDVVMNNLADFARVIICGQISQYNLADPEMGPRNIGLLIIHQARMEGFLVTQFQNRYAEGRQRLAQWIREGKLKYREDIVDGLEKAPEAFIGMMNGKNFGKLVVRVSEA